MNRQIIQLFILEVIALLFFSRVTRADSTSSPEAPDFSAFPIGIFDVSTADDLDAAKMLGCNFVETKGGNVTEAFTGKAQSLNLAVIPFLLDGKMAVDDIAARLDALKLDRFRDVKTFPVIFGIDEPSGGRVPAKTVIATYQQLHQVLNQPQITLLNRVLETSDYFNGYDILALDPYPVVYADPVGGRLSTVSQEVDLAKKANGNKPIWIAIQAFGNYGGWQRAPHGDELEAMVGLAVTHGANGIWYYTWDVPNAKNIKMVKQLPELQDAIREVSRKMSSVAPLLSSPDQDIRLVHGPAHVRILTKDEEGAVLVAHSKYDARSVAISSALFQNAQIVDIQNAAHLNAGILTVNFPSCGFDVVRFKLPQKASTPVQAALAITPEAPPDLVLNDFASIAASSNSPGERGGTYGELKMGDGSLNDNWASAQHYKLPIKIRVTFEQPRTLSQVVVHPLIITGTVGYDAWGDTEVVTSNGQSIKKTFTKSDGGPYTFDLKPGQMNWFEVIVKTTLSKTNYIGCREIEIH